MPIDIVDWFEYLTGLKPTENQVKLMKAAIDPNVRKILISAGFQSGKTLTTAVIIMWYVFQYIDPVKVILISAQDNIMYFHMREMFKHRPELVEQLSPRSQLAADLVPIHGFELDRGSIVFIRGATEKQIRGTPADIVVLDEGTQVKNSIILESIGRITGSIAKYIILSTPDNDASLFVKWATEEDSGFSKFTWEATIEECPWHNQEQEDLKKKEYSKQQYASLVLGRPPTKAERAFFARGDIEQCFATVESIREGGPTSRLEVGLDTGRWDETVYTLTERIGTSRRKVLFIKRFSQKDRPSGICGPEILKLIEQHKPYLSKMDSKPEEYVDWFKKHGDKIRSVDFRIHKEQMMGQLQKMIREHRLLIPTEFMFLKMALEKYRLQKGEEYYRSKGGKTGGSDLVESLALSCYECDTFASNTGSIVRFPKRNI